MVMSGNGGSRSSEPSELLQTHARLRALDDTPLPEPAFVNRLREDLMHTASPVVADWPRISMNGFAGSAPPPRGASASPAAPIARPRFGHWFSAQFLAAALLVLAIGVGLFGYGIGRPGSGPPATHPAVFAAPGTAIPAATIEKTLAEYDIPAGVLAPGTSGSSTAHFIIPASSTSTWTVPEEAEVHYVLDGALTLTSDKPIQVRRAASGGAMQTTPAGTAVDIGTGDSALISNSAVTTFVNRALTPVVLFSWGMDAGSRSTPPFPYPWTPDVYDLSGAGAVNVPAGAARIRLWQVELAAGATIAPPKGMILQLEFDGETDASGNLTSAQLALRASDGSILNTSTHPITVYVATLISVGGPGGSPVAVSPAASTPAA